MVFPILILSLLTTLCGFPAATYATENENTASSTSPTSLVYQFPNGTWVENIAVRSNGRLLVSLVNVPELWEIDPFTTPAATATFLHRFNGSRQATGLAEIAPDVFAASSDSTIYRVDLNTSPPNITQLVRIQDTTLNGMVYLPSAQRILSSDSSGGVVWSVDLAAPNVTNAYGIALWDETMFPVPGARRSLVGVNGIRYDATTAHVHYVNLPKLLYCRVAVDPATARATGPYEVLARGVMADDFALAPDGTAFLAGLDRNVVYRLGQDGVPKVVAGHLNSSELAGATSVAFGRTEADRDVLYVTTGGAVPAPVNGTYIEGGKVVAVRV